MDDPNIIYGGDFQKWSEIKSPSLGALVIEKLQASGSSKKLFVSLKSIKFNFAEWQILLSNKSLSTFNKILF